MAYRKRGRASRSYGARRSSSYRSRRPIRRGVRRGRTGGRTRQQHVVIHIEHATNPLRDAALPIGKMPSTPANGAFA